jgi:hypothetical protein
MTRAKNSFAHSQAQLREECKLLVGKYGAAPLRAT